MGLRSPQELEQVRKGVPQVGMVEAGKTANINLAEPAQNFMEQKALADQIAAVKDSVAVKKKSLANITSKYAVENATADIKARIAALKGDNAIAEADNLYQEAERDLTDLVDKAPENLRTQVTSERVKKLNELRSLSLTKANTEGQKAAVSKGETISKMYTMDAASKYLALPEFKSDYSNLYQNAIDTNRMKGMGEDEATVDAAFVASNSVFEGVKFSLSQAATPERVAELKDYYEQQVLKDRDIFVTTEDKGKINKAFTSAQDKAENDLGLHLANKAITLGMTPTAANDYIRKNAQGSVKAATSGINLYGSLDRARKDEIAQNDRTIFGRAVKEVRKNNPEAAENIIKAMSPEGELKAREYLNTTQGGAANAYTDPKDFEYVAKIIRDNRLAILDLDLDSLKLNAKDRRAYETVKNTVAKEEQDKNFKIDSGSIEGKAIQQAENIAAAQMGRGAVLNPKTKNAIHDRTRLITYQVRAENPTITNPATLMGLVNQRLQTDLVEEVTEPNFIGDMLQGFTGPSDSKWLNSTKKRVRGAEDFPREVQTGRGAVPSPISKKLVPDPTKDEIISWKNQRFKVTGQEIDDATAKQEIIKLRESKLKAR